jgi:hypothetical protein
MRRLAGVIIHQYQARVINMKKPFKSDGCSGGMSKAWLTVFGELPPWEGACIEHDRAYWNGGTWRDRRAADIRLRDSVVKGGWPIMGWLMYFAVRIGGSRYWPTPWRWNYGEKYLNWRRG